MTITANSGPQINFGITLSSSGAAGDYNEERGPSLNDLCEGTLDPRAPFGYKPGNRPGVPVFGWPGCYGGPVLDFVPITANTSGIAAVFSASAASGTTQVTVATSANSSSIRLISAFIPSTYAGPVSVIMIDGYQQGVAVGQGSTAPQFGAGVSYGAAGTINLWNPLVMGGRCLTVANNAAVASSQATIYISGFDIYGMQMTQAVTGPVASSTVTTLKAFKYILTSGINVVNAAAGSSVLCIGTADVIGFPMFVENFGYASVYYGPSSTAALNTTSSAHTFGFGSSIGIGSGSSLVSTGTTGDVRGTFSLPVASNGTGTLQVSSVANRLTMSISPRPNNLATVTSTNFWALVGVPQA